MGSESLKSDVISFNAAISTCKKKRQWQHVAPFVEYQCEDWLPDVISFSAATSACDKGGQWYTSQEFANTRLTVWAFAIVGHASQAFFDAIAAIAACKKEGLWL
eukprot:10034999-Karenia_brevis.AAC.1